MKNKNNTIIKGEIKKNDNFYKMVKKKKQQNNENQIEKYNTINLN